jgi:polyisoprenoid-binding protein YceI
VDKLILAAIAILCAVTLHAADAPQWSIDYPKSRMTFTAEQAGAEFDGKFDEFRADVRFAPDALASSRARVVVPAASVNSENDERDGYLRGEGWFEVDKYPDVTWEAVRFDKLKDGRYRAVGKLTVRDLTVDLPFDFGIVQNGGEVTLDGTAKMDRLALGLGLGEWANTEWIGKDVLLHVKLVAHLDTAAPSQ